MVTKVLEAQLIIINFTLTLIVKNAYIYIYTYNFEQISRSTDCDYDNCD